MPRCNDKTSACSGESLPRTRSGVDAGSPMRTCAKGKLVAGAVLLASALAGCSDVYLDRRDTVRFSDGDAVATAQAVQVIDPWPAAAYNRNIAYNGPRVAGAIERYRTGRIIEPKGTGTSTSYSAAPQVGQGGGAPNSAGASSSAPPQ
jgi:hypothetical protein